MKIRNAKETDSTLWKSQYFIDQDCISIVNASEVELVMTVLGFHSSDIEDYDAERKPKVPYTVVIRNNGEHTCTCLAFIHSLKEYKQFWGEMPIRSTPECSHIMAVKLTPIYRRWVLKDVPNAEDLANVPLYLKSYVRTSGVQIAPAMPTDLNKIDPVRRPRKVSFEDLTRSDE